MRSCIHAGGFGATDKEQYRGKGNGSKRQVAIEREQKKIQYWVVQYILTKDTSSKAVAKFYLKRLSGSDASKKL